MLLPALASAKLRAHQIRCVSNLKQLALANVMYVGEQKKRYVGPLDPNPNLESGRLDWVRCLPTMEMRPMCCSARWHLTREIQVALSTRPAKLTPHGIGPYHVAPHTTIRFQLRLQ